MIDLNRMALFVRVVQSGGFSAAARALSMPKSSVSRQVAALEHRLGISLLRRNTRSFSLTDAGETYYRRARAIVAEAEAAEAEAITGASEPRGLLRITATIGFGQALLQPVLADYLTRFPDVRIEAHLTDQRVNLVRDGFDLAIRMGVLHDSELAARRLGTFRRVVCASPEYIRRRGVPEQPTDLRNHDCLVIERSLRAWQFEAAGPGAIVHVPWRLCINHIDLIRAAARAGRGIANLPHYLVADDLAVGTLVALLSNFSQPSVEITAVYPADHPPSPPLRALIDLLAERLRTMRG
jgi:DNA-binding transcriptional LysR family regulator